MSTPTFAELARIFGRIGVLSFGGPAAQIALMHKELVDDRDWLDEDTFLRALSLCMLLPGPEAMQLATYAGWRLRGTAGGLLAGLLFVLPGALVIAILAALYVAFGNMPVVQAGFLGVKAAVIVIVLQALKKLSSKALISPEAWVIAGIAFVAIFAFNVPFPVIIAVAAVVGLITTTANKGDPPKAPINSRPVQTILVWGGIWLLPLILLSMSGLTLLSDIGWLFAKLAVVTFGGAYAVLAYLTQTVAMDYQWLTTSQMIDALGLAETTPGPLILVTQFVAMLTGFTQAGAIMGIAAGLVALWATFIPCFLWIFLAGPFVENIASRPRIASALAAITAAVVGVVLNLSVWFALHVWFTDVRNVSLGSITVPLPDFASLKPEAIALTCVAAVLMLVLNRGMVGTLAIVAGVSIVWAQIAG